MKEPNRQGECILKDPNFNNIEQIYFGSCSVDAIQLALVAVTTIFFSQNTLYYLQVSKM